MSTNRHKPAVPTGAINRTGSAFIMVWIALLAYVSTYVIWEWFRIPGLKSEILLQSTSQEEPSLMLTVFVAFLILLIFFAIPGTFIIRKWDDSYFGWEGAIRWAVFGILFGNIIQLKIFIPEANTEDGFSVFFAEQSLKGVLGITNYFISHFLAFKAWKKTSV